MAARTPRSPLASQLVPELFRALSEPNRIAILTRLAIAGCEQTVSEVARCCPVNLSVVSRHLKTLREAGLLSAERRGKEVYYRARARQLATQLRALADALDGCCACCAPDPEDGDAE
jgi:ArsR family transcriptional regulator